MSNTKLTPDNDWIPHDGSGCPVDADALVAVRFRSGREDLRPARASYWADHEQDHWVDDGSDAVIVAYQIVRQEGR